MIIACLAQKTLKLQTVAIESQTLLKEAVWIDLISPSKEEETQVEQCIGLDVPTREEMREIELSSRLYRDNGTLFMTATMIAQSDSPDPKLEPVTFVLTQQQLITLRDIEPQSFKLAISHLQKFEPHNFNAIALFIELLEATVDRLADILELVGSRLDEYSKTIFHTHHHQTGMKLDYQQLMQQIGANGDLNTKARESLMTFNRLVSFFGQAAVSRINDEGASRLTTLSKDIFALSDHASFLSSKINFLLDATLGMVTIEQNKIIKIFSVVAVIFLPPTLIASIYGMNFHVMPELSWKFGYLLAIGLILLSAWLPYRFFKYKKWL